MPKYNFISQRLAKLKLDKLKIYASENCNDLPAIENYEYLIHKALEHNWDDAEDMYNMLIALNRVQETIIKTLLNTTG